MSEEATSSHAYSMSHKTDDPISHAVQPSFYVSGACWKTIQAGFKSNTKFSSKDKSTLRDSTNIIQCEREKIQIRCPEMDMIPHLILCSYNSLVMGATCAGEK